MLSRRPTGLGDGSAVEHLPLEWGPKFHSQDPYKRFGAEESTCNYNTGETVTGRSLGLTGYPV